MGFGRSAHQSSPRFMADGSKLCCHHGSINWLLPRRIHGVQALGNQRVLPLAEVLLDGLRIELAAGHAETMGKLLRSGEDRVGQGDGHFHAATVSPWYYQRNVKRYNGTLHP